MAFTEAHRRRLEKAAFYITSVVADLDRSDTTCSCCQITRHNNRLEHQAALELEAAAQKCHRWLARLGEGNEFKGPAGSSRNSSK